MIKLIFIILAPVSLVFSISYNNEKCIVNIENRDIIRNVFTNHEILQSENFAIHFTISDLDSQLVNGQMVSLQSNYGYAQSILDHAESALAIYIEDGWESPPPDCDESISDIDSSEHCINFGGNSLYDIYFL